jgi:hypothetical protein
MFQICVLEQNVQEKQQRYVLEIYSKCNEIKNIKIHNIFNIIEISKSMEPMEPKCIHDKKFMKFFT